MKKGEKVIKKDKILIIRIIIMLIIGCVAIFTDYRLGIVNTSLNQLIPILFTTVTVIAGLWISCYLLFLQLYKDRYPIKVLKECYLPNMRQNFFLLIFCIVYGSVVIVINNGIVANLFYSVICIDAIFEILIKIYNTNKSLMTNTYVDRIFSEINDELDDSNNVIQASTFKNVKYILDESIVKEEYFIVQNITERLGEVYRKFLKNSLSFEGENSNASDIEKSFDNIISFNISELKLCRKINSEITIDKIINQQKENLKFCIEKNQYEWFKRYLDNYNAFVFKTEKEGTSALTDKLYYTYRSVVKELILLEKKEWFKYTNEQLINLIKSLVFFYDSTGIRNYCNLISGAMIFCIEEDKKDYYDELLNSFCEFSLLISKNLGTFNNVKMCYATLFNMLLEKSYNYALIFYEKALEESFGISEDPMFLEFKMYCVNELQEKEKHDISSFKALCDKQIDLLTEIINIKEKYQGYLVLPDFKSLIKESQYSKDELSSIKERMEKLLNNCIVKDNLPIYFVLLNNLNKILIDTEQRQKEVQKELIGIYIFLIFRTRFLLNKQYLEVTFDLFKNLIQELDSKRKISSDLGDCIIENISCIAQNANNENHMVIIKSIDLLYSFLDEKEHVNFVISSKDKKKKLYRTMFNIGTDCIENNYEDGLRRVSNAIGWFTINSIKQGNSNLSEYLIERAIELYDISKRMEITSKTLTFILTLFTTVGTFCCKNNTYKTYLDKVLNGIQNEDISRIKTAISLRTSENDTWNELFDNNTFELSKKFVYEFEKIKSNN